MQNAPTDILKLAHRYKDIHTEDIHNPSHAYTLVPKKQMDLILDDSSFSNFLSILKKL